VRLSFVKKLFTQIDKIVTAPVCSLFDDIMLVIGCHAKATGILGGGTTKEHKNSCTKCLLQNTVFSIHTP